MPEWLQRNFLENFQPNLQFLQLAERSDAPQGYNQLRWARFTPVAESSITAGTTSNDGVTPSDTAIAVTTTTVTPTQYRIVFNLADMLLETTPLDLLGETAREAGRVMAKRIDTEIQAVIAAGTNVIYATGSTRTGLGAGDVLTMALINRATARMMGNDIPPVDGTYYAAVVHPYAIYDLRSSTAAGSWLDVNKYANPEAVMTGEVARAYGARIVVSSHITTFSSTVTVYPTYVVGRGAFGAGFTQQPQVMITPAGASDSDPAAQRRKVAAKCAFGTVILNQNALVRIESAATTA
ncbi:MAG: N4-gp56 family major capsid protein [Acidobacteriota bacterium]|nr:N4-gp56 family major capsid protein [Acidobacteriota bacterium]